MTDFNQCAFPTKISNIDGTEYRDPGLTKLEYATLEILKSPYLFEAQGDEGLIKDAIKLAKEALKQLAEEH